MVSGFPLCSCSTFAVGFCADCNKPVCGYHSEMVGDSRRCRPCADIYRAGRVAANRRREEAAAEAKQRDQPAFGDLKNVTKTVRCRYCDTEVPVRNKFYAEHHMAGDPRPILWRPDACEGSNRKMRVL
jgi:hypothetical protein